MALFKTHFYTTTMKFEVQNISSFHHHVYKECIFNSVNIFINIVFALLLMVFIVYLSKLCCPDGRGRHHSVDTIVKFQHNTSRWLLSICLLCVYIFSAGEGIFVLTMSSSSFPQYMILLNPCSGIVTLICTIWFYHKAEEQNRPLWLLFLLIYWTFLDILSVAKLMEFINTGLTVYHLRLQLTWFSCVVLSLLVMIDLTQLLRQVSLCQKSNTPRIFSNLTNICYLHPFVTLLSKATFFWMIPLLRLGYQRPLELDDLGQLPEQESAENQFKRFYKHFVNEQATSAAQGRRLSLWKCYWKTFWRTLGFGGILKIVGDFVGLIGPLSINIIIAYVTSVQQGTYSKASSSEVFYPTAWEFFSNGYVMSLVVLMATFLQSTLSNNFNHLAIAEGIHLRSALQCLIYKKSLRISSSGLDVGAVVNHMSVDAFNMMMLFSMGHYIWAVPVKIILLLVLLYMQLGYSAVIGAATIYVLAPLQYQVSRMLSKIQKKALNIADERLKRTSELLQGIKLLKLYGWELMYADLIQRIRLKEINVLKSDAIYVALNTFLTQASSIVVTLVTFVLYSKLEGKPLTPSEVFTGLALFNQLTVPLYIIPFVIPIVINSVVSTKRLVDFFSKPEVDLSIPWREENRNAATVEFCPESGSVMLHIRDSVVDTHSTSALSDDGDGVFLPEILNHLAPENSVVVRIQKGSFGWDVESPILQDINLQIPSGKLTIVIGPVGSGKTSLILALLGEMRILEGSVQWVTTSSVAYVAQNPWLLNATLKDNILFGQPYDCRRYHQVIQACALQPDIDLLPAKDMTEIGERGINLSGGQRQRIALARAFYSQARTVILDDPLSALDVHVGAHVFEHGIKTLLLRRFRTVILVTNKVENLSQAAKIVVLENGRVKQQGTLPEIQKANGDLYNSWMKVMQHEERAKLKCSTDEGTVKERHRLVRMLSKQTLFRTVSSQDTRPRLLSLTRQVSHDPSSPLPCHDWGDHDDSLPHVPDPDDPAICGFLNRIRSTDSLKSKSSSSSFTNWRQPWRRPPSRMNSRISGHASDDYIKEEEEYELVDEITGESERIENQMTAGKLIMEEEREKGKIPKKIYVSYMKACSLSLAVAVVILIILTQGVKVGTDFWLSEWSENSKYSNETDFTDPTFTYYMTGYAIFSGACIVLSLVTNLAAQLTSLRAVYVLHARMLTNIVKCPMRFFDTTPVGRILNRFSSDMSTIDKKLPVTLPVLLRFILLCTAAIIVDVIVTPYFLVSVIFIVPIYYFIQHFFRYTSRELQRLDSITKSPIFSHFSETLSGLTIIRAYREESRFLDKLNSYMNTNNSAFLLMNCANCWLGISLDYLGGIILFAATIGAITAAVYNQISPAFVGVSMTYTLLVPIYLNWVVRNLASVEMYMSAVERVASYSELPTEDTNNENSKVVPFDWPSEGEIRFEGVTLKYDTNLDPVLCSVNLIFKPGEKVGICGRTGSGKSSLVMALFRMVHITEGKIVIDDQDISSLPRSFVCSKLSIIPQDTVMFSGTVRENLNPGLQCDDKELWHVLDKTQLKSLIEAMPGGLDAAVAEEGSNFSVGQRQLLCLARALLRKSPILIMDEAMSSLDPETETIIQKVIEDNCKNCTILSIAHRISSIMNYDTIVVLDAGQVVEVGTPEQLMLKKGSMFASLVKAHQQQ